MDQAPDKTQDVGVKPTDAEEVVSNSQADAGEVEAQESSTRKARTNYVTREHLIQQNRELLGRIGELEDVAAKLVRSHVDQSRNDAERVLDSLKSQRRQAQSDSDFELADQLDDKIYELRKQIDEAKAVAKQELAQKDQRKSEGGYDPGPEIISTLRNWADNNEWYKTNPRLQRVADALMSGFREEGLSLKRALSELDKEMASRYGDEIGGSDTVSRVSSGGRNPRTSGPKSRWEDLPTEVQKDVDRILKGSRIYKTREDVLKDMDNYEQRRREKLGLA